MKKEVIILLVSALLLFGCINLDFLGGKPAESGTQTQQGTQAGQTSQVTAKNESAGSNVVITSETNQSVVHNETAGTEPEKKPGINYEQTPELPFIIDFIYVGDETHQGDAILIKKGDADILVDAGPDKSGAKLDSFLKSRGIDDIELLISSHADPEHYSGIYSVADKYDIEELWWTGKNSDNAEYSVLLSKMTAKGIPLKTVSVGKNITINGMKIEVFNPYKPGGAFGGVDGLDNDAIALKVTDRDFCILLTSDILFGAQTYMQNNENVKCKIMQAPYHGLGTGNAQIGQFLIKVNPKDVIVSGGPSENTQDLKGTRFSLYELLDLYKITHYDNYKGKTVEITSDGTSYGIKYVG